MGTFNVRFNKEANPANAFKLTKDLGLCCDEQGTKCLYEVELSDDDVQDVTGITVAGETVNFEAVETAEELVALLNSTMQELGYVGSFSASIDVDFVVISATCPVVIESLAGGEGGFDFVEKCTPAVLCDFKVNYKPNDTTPQPTISYDGGATTEDLPFRAFATATDVQILNDITPTLPPNASLTVIKNETLLLFELIFNAPDTVNIVVNSPLGELTAEKCNCEQGWIVGEGDAGSTPKEKSKG